MIRQPFSLLILVILAIPSLGTADIVFFNNKSSFGAALGGVPNGFESFETDFNGESVAFPIGEIAEFTLSESEGIVNNFRRISGIGGSNTSGNFVAFFQDSGESIATFEFTRPVNAFGIDITISRADNDSIAVGGDISTNFQVFNSSPTFFGVIDTTGSFQKISFEIEGTETFNVFFDSAFYATAIPEPGSRAVFAVASCIGLGTRRRRTKVA